ncbi:protease-associated domain-containing protein 1-like [Ptychodera flava]|uniref:protease-associated domain-containing protein 1-like n=1 Tax=Ptychodera flava TaxID=63121 RepID=UPI003969C0A6
MLAMATVMGRLLLWLVLYALVVPLALVQGYAVNENLFFEVLSPPDINYIFKIRPAKSFGEVFRHSFYRINLVPTNPAESCSDLYNGEEIRGAIALIERGGCSFLSKTRVAERFGAVAVIIHDHDYKNDWQYIDMIQDESDRTANIPAMFLLGKDGYLIKKSLQANGMPGAIISIPVNVTGVPLHHLRMPPWTLW